MSLRPVSRSRLGKGKGSRAAAVISRPALPVDWISVRYPRRYLATAIGTVTAMIAAVQSNARVTK